MPMRHEVALANLALYQQALRTAERIKTLHREIDDISREIYKQLDDLDIIIEEVQSKRPPAAFPHAVVSSQECRHEMFVGLRSYFTHSGEIISFTVQSSPVTGIKLT